MMAIRYRLCEDDLSKQKGLNEKKEAMKSEEAKLSLAQS